MHFNLVHCDGWWREWSLDPSRVNVRAPLKRALIPMMAINRGICDHYNNLHCSNYISFTLNIKIKTCSSCWLLDVQTRESERSLSLGMLRMFGPAAGLWVEATIVNTQTGNNTTKHYLRDGSEGRKSIKADENKSFLSYSRRHTASRSITPALLLVHFCLIQWIVHWSVECGSFVGMQ